MTTSKQKGYRETQQAQHSYGPHWLPLAVFIFVHLHYKLYVHYIQQPMGNQKATSRGQTTVCRYTCTEDIKQNQRITAGHTNSKNNNQSLQRRKGQPSYRKRKETAKSEGIVAADHPHIYTRGH